MKVRSVLVTTLLLCGSLAFAQVCPQVCPPTSSATTCLVPSRAPRISCNRCATVPACGTCQVATVPMCNPCGGYGFNYGAGYPQVSLLPSTSYSNLAYPSYSMMPSSSAIVLPYSQGTGIATTSLTSPQIANVGLCPMSNNSDTACIINEMRAMRGDIQLSAIQLQGQALVNRMDQLMANETAFRLALVNNPNLPGAQQQAIMLMAQSNALNRDLGAFQTQLASVPVGLRPFIAPQLSSFDVAVWQPALQRFACYQASFPQMAAAYQPAFAANTWLQPWIGSYQASITGISQLPQTFASARWWMTGSPVVLGSVESLTGGSTMMLPNGTAVFIPAGGTLNACAPVATTTTTGMVCSPNMFGMTMPGVATASVPMGTTPEATVPMGTAPMTTPAPATTTPPTGTAGTAY